jgi:hypothetical protein
MKRIMKGFILVFAIATMASCDLLSLFKKGNSSVFTVTKGSSTEKFNWPAKYDTVGFMKMDSGNFTNIFAASDNKEDSETFYKYLFLSTTGSGVGIYGTSSGFDPISYYDANGDLFMVFASDAATKSEITVSKWDSSEIKGTFNGTLRNLTGTYITISGSFTSFEKASSRDFSGQSGSDEAEARALLERDAARRAIGR